MSTSLITLFLTGFLGSTLLLKISQTFFLKKNIIDEINDRSSHRVIATRSGGIAIFITVLAISLVGDGLNDALNPKLRSR